MTDIFRRLVRGDGWPDEPELPSEDAPPVPTYSICLSLLWLVPVFIYWLLDFLLTRRRRTVRESSADVDDAAQSVLLQDDEPEESAGGPRINTFVGQTQPGYFPVMLASLEHSLPHLQKGRATAGGLGKVVDLIARKHPTDILLVHPMMKQEEGKLQYGQACEEQMPLRLVIDGERCNVRVYRFVPPSDACIADSHVEFLMLLGYELVFPLQMVQVQTVEPEGVKRPGKC